MLAQIDLRLRRPVEPPAEIFLHATLTRHLGPLTQFDVEAVWQDATAAKGSLTLVTVEGPDA
jgi:3-hydroxymyristoyl/3-hydroxydecanoyl-(acyl carrier protein) dehydratase